jgi:hypothetical protein
MNKYIINFELLKIVKEKGFCLCEAFKTEDNTCPCKVFICLGTCKCEVFKPLQENKNQEEL